MTAWHFYSRSQGWASDECPRRYYTSPVVVLSDEAACPHHGRSGASIAGDVRAPEALRDLARLYPGWFFYPAGTDLGCGPENYV